jgi:hypothetical protein
MIPPSAARQRRLSSPHLLLLLAMLVAACGPFRRTPESESVYVTFVNESSAQLDIFAVTPGSRFRLTTLSPGRSERVRLPDTVVGAGAGGVNFVARVFPDRGTISSGSVTIIRGDELQVRIPPTMTTLVVTPI